MSSGLRVTGGRRRIWVRRMDRLAEAVITVGGLAVLAAVLGICVYLVLITAPLFTEGGVEPEREIRDAGGIGRQPLIFDDEFVEGLRVLAVVGPDGVLRTIRLDNGEVIDSLALREPGSIATATAMDTSRSTLAVGYEDGMIRAGSIRFVGRKVALGSIRTTLQSLRDVDDSLKRLEARLSGAEPLAGLLRGRNPITALIDDDDAYGATLDLVEAGETAPDLRSALNAGLQIADSIGFGEPIEGDPEPEMVLIQRMIETLNPLGVRRGDIRGIVLDASVRAVAIDSLASLEAIGRGGPDTRVGIGGLGEPRRFGISFGETERYGLATRSVGEDAIRITVVDTQMRDAILLDGPVASISVARGRINQQLLVGVDDSGRATWRSAILPGADSNLVGQREVVEVRTIELASPARWIFPLSDARSVIAVGEDGVLHRYGPTLGGVFESPMVLLGTVEVGEPITAAAMESGGGTVLLGAASGTIRACWLAQDPMAAPDGVRLFVRDAYETAGQGSIVTFDPSPRERTFAFLDSTGFVQILHLTSGKRSGAFQTRIEAPSAIAMTPKVDGVAVVGQGGIDLWSRLPGHADTSWASLFRPVLYEGATAPENLYQSRAEDKKLGLQPLIFGTLKATVVALLIAAPLGVLAAIYSSEFLAPRPRKIIKPGIELMASLPSVVLGFVAVAIVAPFVELHLAGVLVALVSFPVGALAAAAVWDALPDHSIRKIRSLSHLLLAVVAVGIGVTIAFAAGRLVERISFQPTKVDRLVLAERVVLAESGDVPEWVGLRDALDTDDRRKLWREDEMIFLRGRVYTLSQDPGDVTDWDEINADLKERGLIAPSIRRWLDTTIGLDHAAPGWMLLLALPSLAIAVIIRRVVSGILGLRVTSASTATRLLASLGRFALVVGLAWALAMLGGYALDAAGLDARDHIIGRFDRLNTLVVGFIMGFAIIPLIYTISEDALRSVPDSLRAASLGAGATPWQTAIRVVLPVAASGIFSACMIGLGRGVGETMIVLMATGNTPEMSMNIFSGFRTLAANIATELPEADVGSTHYRVLFLCGLTLFTMTLVINTTAEIVRQRYRKRSAGL